MKESKTPWKGSCLCGSVRFEVDAIGPQIGHCHCSMCRKFHGAEFATYGEATRDHFHWVSGEDNLSSYRAPNGTTRQFCKICGSSLTFSPASNPEGIVEFALGALDSDIPHKPDAHIFVGFKANWSTIHDELPQYTEGRNSKRKA
jgi:hypothetical protein